jgi:hypothetical protein
MHIVQSLRSHCIALSVATLVSGCGGNAEPERTPASPESALPGPDSNTEPESPASEEAPRGEPADPLTSEVSSPDGSGDLPPVSFPPELMQERRSCIGEAGCPWSVRSPMLLHGARHAAVAHEGKVYVLGGQTWEDGPVFSGMREYDPVTQAWSERARLPHGNFFITAHSLGGKLYTFSGFNGEGFEPYVQEYDPSTDQWSQHEPLPTLRSQFSTAAVGGRVYVIGGRGLVGGAEADAAEDKAAVHIFDPAAGWSEGAPLPQAVSGAASCELGGEIFVFGGNGNNLTSIYDVAGNSWSYGSPPPIARGAHACARAGTRLFLFGGWNAQGTALNLVESYDPATDTWTTHPPMPTPRYTTAAVTLNDDMYVFGGAQYVPEPTPENYSGLLDAIEVMSTASAL